MAERMGWGQRDVLGSIGDGVEGDTVGASIII
jgi:hypothetical protein